MLRSENKYYEFKGIVYKRLRQTILEVKGCDRQRFLQAMLTADIKWIFEQTHPQQAVSGIFYLLDTKAKVQGAGEFLCFDEGAQQRFFLCLDSERVDAFIEYLDRYVISEDVSFEKKTWSYLLAFNVAKNLKDRDWVSYQKPLANRSPKGREKVWKAQLLEEHGKHLAYVYSPQWGEDAWKLWISDEELFQQEISALGSECVTEISEAKYESLRIHCGIPKWGVDWDETSLLLEYPYVAGVSFFKGCYLGQEVVARASLRGRMPKGFCLFLAQENTGDLKVDFIYSENNSEKPVGKLTSASASEGLGILRFQALDSIGQFKLYQKAQNNKKIYIEHVEILIDDKILNDV